MRTIFIRQYCRICMLITAACIFQNAFTDELSPPKSLDIQIIPVGPTSFYGNYTLIKGKKNIMLVDVPFARSDALRVAAEILDSGKKLEKIYITHDHPDHFFSLDVFMDEFPDVDVIAHPQVVNDIQHSFPLKMERWSSVLAENSPRRTIIPSALEKNHFEFEGHRMEVIGPMQADHARSTVLWIPGEKTMIVGDVAFHQIHVWFGEHNQTERLAWIDTLDKLIGLSADKVILGHRNPKTNEINVDAASLEWTREYILNFNKEVEKASDAKDLAERLINLYPQAGTISAGAMMFHTSCRVAMGEIPPWRE